MKRDKKVAELGGDCRELRNCGSQILKFRNRGSATFLVRNSAIVLVVRNIAELRKCGLKLRMPTFDYMYCSFIFYSPANILYSTMFCTICMDRIGRNKNYY
jgi:hypothetical protein